MLLWWSCGAAVWGVVSAALPWRYRGRGSIRLSLQPNPSPDPNQVSAALPWRYRGRGSIRASLQPNPSPDPNQVSAAHGDASTPDEAEGGTAEAAAPRVPQVVAL